MPRAVKGQRFGGRIKGIPNKATIERALIAARTVEEAKATGKPLAKEVLDQFMQLFAGMAAHYQPLPEGALVPANRKPNPELFEKWARLTISTARALAPYQSPTYSAVMVAPAPPDPRGKVTRFTLEVFEHSGRPPITETTPGGGNGKIVEHEAGS